MSRARTLSPSFFTDERVVSVSPFARLLFQGLWCEADREGRLEDRPLGLKMRLFPADQVDVSALLDELVKAGLVQRYAVGGRGYLLVPNFAKHQHPHPKEVQSRLPAPPSTENNGKFSPSIVPAVESNGSPLTATASPSAPLPASRAGSSGSSGSSVSSGSTGAAKSPAPEAHPLQAIWNRLKAPEQPEWKSTSKARKAQADARWEERPSGDWEAIVQRLAASAFARGANERGWVANPTFLLRPDTAARVLEGNYDDRAGKPRGSFDPNQGIITSQHADDDGPGPDLDFAAEAAS